MKNGEVVLVPGGRDVRGTLDAAHDRQLTSDDADKGSGEVEACVVACPPHPNHRGHRGDERLRAVSERVQEDGIDCLRFDYGPWDEGRGERADVLNAVDWARDRYHRVAIFGYSFGGSLALIVSSETDVAAVAALAPTARVSADLDAVAALDAIECPVMIVYGSRDETAEWKPLVDRARGLGYETTALSADHFFVGQARKIGDTVGEWLASRVE